MKKIRWVLPTIIVLLIAALIICNIIDDRTISRFQSKAALVKIGMPESAVIRLLGKPNREYWTEADDSFSIDSRIREKYNKLRVITYLYPTIYNKLPLLSKRVWGRIYLDEKENRVVAIPIEIY